MTAVRQLDSIVPLVTEAPAPVARRSGPLEPALVLITVLALVLAVVAAGAVVAAQPDDPRDATEAGVGLLYVVVGVVAWQRRPGNRTGLLICVTGLLFLLATLFNTDQPVMIFLGLFGGQAVLAGVLHLLLAFPSGRPAGPLDRTLVVAGYASTVVPLLLQYAFSGRPEVLPFLDGGPRPDIAALADLGHRIAATAVLLTAAGVLVQRWRTTRITGHRRSRAVVSLLGMAVLVSIPVTALVIAPVVGMSGRSLFLLQLGLLSVVPFVFAIAILRGGFARTARIEELGMWLGAGDDGRATVREALATALGDVSLQLHYPGPDGRLVDAAGLDVATAAGTRVSVPGPGAQAVAVITYDDALIAEPSTVEQAGRVVALALERERLTAELLARSRELQESRLRLVEVADDGRRRVAQDLHDTLQGRLVLATLHAGALAVRPDLDDGAREAADALRTELTEGIAEVRRLVHGLMPALLIERGLHAAAEDVLDRSPVPVEATWAGRLDTLPPAVSSNAYFMVAELLANAVKHSGASTIRVHVARTPSGLELEFADDGVGGAAPTGAGLRGLRDRVDVLGGHLRLTSPLGGGTHVRVWLPCA